MLHPAQVQLGESPNAVVLDVNVEGVTDSEDVVVVITTTNRRRHHTAILASGGPMAPAAVEQWLEDELVRLSGLLARHTERAARL